MKIPIQIESQVKQTGFMPDAAGLGTDNGVMFDFSRQKRGFVSTVGLLINA